MVQQQQKFGRENIAAKIAERQPASGGLVSSKPPLQIQNLMSGTTASRSKNINS